MNYLEQLQNELQKVQTLKNKYAKESKFELAAQFRDKEKIIRQKIEELNKELGNDFTDDIVKTN